MHAALPASRPVKRHVTLAVVLLTPAAPALTEQVLVQVLQQLKKVCPGTPRQLVNRDFLKGHQGRRWQSLAQQARPQAESLTLYYSSA